MIRRIPEEIAIVLRVNTGRTRKDDRSCCECRGRSRSTTARAERSGLQAAGVVKGSGFLGSITDFFTNSPLTRFFGRPFVVFFITMYL